MKQSHLVIAHFLLFFALYSPYISFFCFNLCLLSVYVLILSSLMNNSSSQTSKFGSSFTSAPTKQSTFKTTGSYWFTHKPWCQYCFSFSHTNFYYMLFFHLQDRSSKFFWNVPIFHTLQCHIKKDHNPELWCTASKNEFYMTQYNLLPHSICNVKKIMRWP